jgi:tetratricopeptide (TPR) repeat protein
MGGQGTTHRLYSFVLVGLLGLIPLMGSPEAPDEAIRRFAAAFGSRDVKAMKALIHPDIASEKEIRGRDIKVFFERFAKPALRLTGHNIDERMKSEDGKVERFRATLSFAAPPIAPQYAGPSELKITLLWMLDKQKWWLERPLSIYYTVTSTEAYPSQSQQELAMRFEATLNILDEIGMLGQEDIEISGIPARGNALQDYIELEGLHTKERTEKGVSHRAHGVNVLLKAAAREEGGFLRRYHGDFKSGPKDKRKPMPWDMFRDYVQAAIDKGLAYEKMGDTGKAVKIYRRVISLGRQLLNEPGGFHFVSWGLTFQYRAATELGRVLRAKNDPEAEKVPEFASLCSRRLDLIQTALRCLDDLADYNALEAAIIASERQKDLLFRPWGINTLAIYAEKGAPAEQEIIRRTGAMVRVKNARMQAKAAQVLEDLAASRPKALGSFIQFQRDWVRSHRVYGTAGPST